MLTSNKRSLIDTLRVHIAPVGFEVAIGSGRPEELYPPDLAI
jgi:hypothetical protein